MSQPRVLLVTSASAPPGAVTPVLAALEAAGLSVRAIDVGRAGAAADGTLERVWRAFASEVAERRLMREISALPPDVTLTFDPITTMAMGVVRDEAPRPAPVVAIVADLDPDGGWASADADRYLALDDESAVGLAAHGVEAERIITIGPVCERAFSEAGAMSRETVRKKFGLGDKLPIVLIQVAGMGYELSSHVALQLSLLGQGGLLLFDAGDDADAAMALRHQVPTLDIKAKLFGRTDDAPLLWRAADIVVARPTDTAVARALALGAWMVSFLPEDKRAEALAAAVEARGLGTTATSALLLSSALEPLLGKRKSTDERVGVDGAATIADVAWIVGSERREVLDERRARARAETHARVSHAADAAEAAARVTAAAGGLEDLSGGGDVPPVPVDGVPSREDITKLRAEVSARLAQVSRTVLEARQAAERWDQRREQAAGQGGSEAVRAEAERSADAERSRMHRALAEMATLQSELERLERAAAGAPRTPPAGAGRAGPGAGSSPGPRPGSRPGTAPGRAADQSARSATGAPSPSVDDLLSEMRNKADKKQATIDAELEALKRKMRTGKKP